MSEDRGRTAQQAVEEEKRELRILLDLPERTDHPVKTSERIVACALQIRASQSLINEREEGTGENAEPSEQGGFEL